MEDNYKLPFILIVDDSAYNRECLTEILQDSYKIMQAENGATALDLIKSFKAELACVLLDLNMGWYSWTSTGHGGCDTSKA